MCKRQSEMGKCMAAHQRRHSFDNNAIGETSRAGNCGDGQCRGHVGHTLSSLHAQLSARSGPAQGQVLAEGVTPTAPFLDVKLAPMTEGSVLPSWPPSLTLLGGA